MSMDIGRRVDTSAIVWGALTVGAAVSVYVALYIIGMSVDFILVGVVAAFCLLFLATRPTQKSLFFLVFLSILLNVANYTVFSFTATGESVDQGAESRLLVLMRLPIVFLAVAIPLMKYSGTFLRFLSRNLDVLLFCTVPFFAILYSPDKVSAIQYSVWFAFAMLTILALCFIVGLYTRKESWLENISWLLLWAYIPVTILVLFSIPSYFGGFLRSAYSDSTFYAFTCPVVLVALLVIERHKNFPGTRMTAKMPVYLLLMLVAINALPIVLSAKRSAIVATVLALLIYVVSNKASGMSKKASTAIRSALVIGTIAAVGWTFMSQANTTFMRFERLMDPAQTDNSFEIRQQIWRTSVDLVVADFPFFGVGLNNGKIATEQFAVAEEGAGKGLHSTFLAIFVEMGGVGLILFLFIALRSLHLWRKWWPSTSKWNLVILALPPIMISLTEYNLLPGQALFWPFWMAILLPRTALARDLEDTRGG
jgi:hypothetical protein